MGFEVPLGVDVLVSVLEPMVRMWAVEIASTWPEGDVLRTAAECGARLGDEPDALRLLRRNRGDRRRAGAALDNLAKGLACASLAPGGVAFGGRRWTTAVAAAGVVVSVRREVAAS